MKQSVTRFMGGEEAAVSSEHAILLSLIAVAIFSAVQLFGTVVAALYNRPELSQIFNP